MNPNAPEHQPLVARDVTVIKSVSDKFWSSPDVEIIVKLNKLVADLDALNDRRKKITASRKASGRVMKLPTIPLLSRTPLATESNTCRGTKVTLSDGLHVLNPSNGTLPVCTEATLEFICDYANKWHGLLSNEDYRSPGQAPKFFCLDDSFHTDLVSLSPEDMAAKVLKKLPPTQFWRLRYLFIPITFQPDPQVPAKHAALCCISPEAKSVDYLCSGGDTGLIKGTPRFDGSKCITALFAFLSSYLSLPTPFLPSSWTFRGTASSSQDLKKGYCAQYATGQAMHLAFGWGITWPADHQAKMPVRRQRYVQDLLLHGFAHHNPDPAEKNWQYYPLLDVKPTAEKADKFLALPKEVKDALPGWAIRRRECYVGCKSKAELALHCRRNRRFYPDYVKRALDDTSGLKEYVEWVEEQDWKRRMGTSVKGVDVLDYSFPDAVPKTWIDPRVASKQPGLNGLEDALWK